MRNIGKINETVLDRSVIKPIKQNKVGLIGASKGLDCAFFNDNAISTGYVAFKDAKCCRHAIFQACNNLWAQGVIPEIVTLSISMPDSYREIKLKEIMKQACEAATELNIKIAGGHTEFVKELSYPIISVSALGKSHFSPDFEIDKKSCDIVMTKWMGLTGTSILASEKQDELLKRLPAFYVQEASELDQFCSVAKESKIAMDYPGTRCMHDISGGGVFAAIWEICNAFSGGCRVELSKIPVLQETIEVAEVFDINPYRLRGDGSLIIICEDGESLVEILKENEIMATVIGKTSDDLNRLIIRDDETRYLEPANGDELINVLCKVAE